MEGMFRATRNAQPSHLRFTIESFSTLLSSSFKRYESCKFEAAECKWKLALYPKGNENEGTDDHISLYLMLDNQDIVKEEVAVSFTLLLFDHIRCMYFSVQETSCFSNTKNEFGFDKFVPLKIFIDPSSGYLKNDRCVFGAEVFCIKSDPIGHCLSMSTTKPSPFCFTWKIENFSMLEEYYRSEVFTTRGHDWVLSLYPKGEVGKGNIFSLFFGLADSEEFLNDGKNVLVEYTLRVINQVSSQHKELENSRIFNSSVKGWGWNSFMSLCDLWDCVVNDSCTVEAEVIVLGSSK